MTTGSEPAVSVAWLGPREDMCCSSGEPFWLPSRCQLRVFTFTGSVAVCLLLADGDLSAPLQLYREDGDGGSLPRRHLSDVFEFISVRCRVRVTENFRQV